jgi:hypothetical protein
MRTSRFDPVNLFCFLPAVAALIWNRGNDFLESQAIVLGLVLISGLFVRQRRVLALPGLSNPLRRWSRKPAIAALIPAVVSALLRVSLLPWIPRPHPVVPDEFSHLFLAKTLLLGRLANPPHVLWRHFETIHIISQPTFSSMYLPGQAVFLTIGKLLSKDYFAGVLLSTAFFCAALNWFLRAYVPPGWALFGSVLAAVRIGAASYWNDSFWGGSVAALGATLMLGAYPRILRRWDVLNTVAFSSGIILLGNTRPYEGAGLIVVLIAALVINAARSTGWRSAKVAPSIAIASFLLGGAGWAMTRQFKAVTGDPFTLPYTVNFRTYGWPTTLPWMKTQQINYTHPEFRAYQKFEAEEHKKITTPRQIPWEFLAKGIMYWRFYFGFILTGVLIYTDRILASARSRVVWLCGLAVLVQTMTEQSGYPHYAAAAAPVFFLFITQGLRRLMRCRPKGVMCGPLIVFATIPMMLLIIGVRIVAMPLSSRPPDVPDWVSWCCKDTRRVDRTSLVARIESEPGEHLVFIRYDPTTYANCEWVYNEPDIDHARIIFARDMGFASNGQLVNFYPNRRVWRVFVLDRTPTIVYDSGSVEGRH